jgi:predicted RND superfamily exporter protein|tara:strand:- start:798 stop:3035 length:2238 start_codon:yes stop_codon:yes gene_type:complete
VITVAAVTSASRVQFDFTIENLFPENDPEVDAYLEFREEFEREDDLISLAYDSGDPFSYENLVKTRELTKAFSQVEGISEVTSLINVELFEPGTDIVMLPVYESIPISVDSLQFLKDRVLDSSLLNDNLVSSNGQIAAFLLELEDSANNHPDREAIMNKIGTITSDTDWSWYEAGIPVLRTRYVQYMLGDFVRFFIPVTIVLLVVLFALFRTIRGTLLPILAVLMADFWVMGIMGAMGFTINIVTYIIPTLVLIVGVADSIHILVKFNQELNYGRDKRVAVKLTIQKIGAAILLTSLTTAVGFLALVSTNITMIREFGGMVAVGVILAFLVSITFIPAMLMILKTPKKSSFEKMTKGFRHRLLEKVVVINNRHYKVIVVSSFFMVALFIFYAMKVDQHSSLMEDLTKVNQLYDDMTFMEKQMGSVLPFEVIVSVRDNGQLVEGGIKNPKILKAIETLQKKLDSIPEIGKILSVIDYLSEMNMAFHEGDKAFRTIPASRELVGQYMFLHEEEFEALTNFDYSGTRLAGRIEDIDSRRAEEIIDEVMLWCQENLEENLDVKLTGTTLMALRINQYLVKNLVVSFLIAFGVIFISMGFLFRSIKLASLSMLPNFIPLLLMASVMGFFHIKLRPTTAMTFAIAFGIAVDDTIHYLVRFRQELFAHGGKFREANEWTLLTTGKAIISTSIILSAGFLIMVTSNFLPSRDFGFLSAVTMLGALLGDLFLLPAMLTLVRPKIPKVHTESNGL